MSLQEKKKLTLRLEKRLIEQAKAYAAKHNISVSELVETFFHQLENPNEDAHTPLVQQLTGILPDTADIEQLRTDYLMDKYG